MSNLFILDVCDPIKGGWHEPKIFEEDTETHLLNKVEKESKDKGLTTVVTRIHGQAVEPLRQYFEKKKPKPAKCGTCYRFIIDGKHVDGNDLLDYCPAHDDSDYF